MPYDPRPTTEGGNRAVDIGFSRKAPLGKFRLIGVDTFDGGDWHDADFDDFADAVIAARKKGGQMTKMYVYNDQGECVANTGSF